MDTFVTLIVTRFADGAESELILRSLPVWLRMVVGGGLMKDTRRRWLMKKLQRYEPYDGEEAAMLLRLTSFVMAHDDCLSRRLKSGHVTGAAWVVDKERSKVLLIHHSKLGLWLQPGGHVENDDTVLETARREAREETGLVKITPVFHDIFDVDVHDIPARETDEGHVHYDVRFLFESSPHAEVRVSGESASAEWVSLDKVEHRNPSPSMMRMVEKTRLFRKRKRR